MNELSENQGKRLAEVLRKISVSGSSFAKKLGIPQSTVSEILAGTRRISGGVAEAIAKSEYNINLNYLYSGRDQPFLPTDGPSSLVEENRISYNAPAAPDQVAGFLLVLDERVRRLEKMIKEK